LEALLLAGVALWCFLTAVAGGLVGLVLGNIRLPVIVLAASSPAAGAGANIGISALAALTAAVTHIRAGRIDWRVCSAASERTSPSGSVSTPQASSGTSSPARRCC
jgi:uncharacterized membrane protein YfcA